MNCLSPCFQTQNMACWRTTVFGKKKLHGQKHMGIVDYLHHRRKGKIMHIYEK